MDDIFNELMQAIDEGSYRYISPMMEHRREVNCAEQHRQWLEEHLSGEGRAHLQQLLDAELRVNLLEDQALVKTALAVGIRLALPR